MTDPASRVRVVSHYPGRLRVRAERFRRDPPLLAEVAEALEASTGVMRVEVSTLTGSVLVAYEPRARGLEDLLDEIMQLGGFDGLETDPTAAEILSRPSPGTRVRDGVGALDDALRVATGNVLDLKLALPMAFGVAGVAMFARGKRTMPQWYDLMIWGVNTFLAVNRPGSGSASGER
jgi:copper chaperone CopZ